MLTVSNSEGDTVASAPLRGDPTRLQFSEMKTDERQGENTVKKIRKYGKNIRKYDKQKTKIQFKIIRKKRF